MDTGVCQPFLVMTADNVGNSVVPWNATTAKVTMTGHGFLHLSADCSDAAQTSLNVTLDPGVPSTKRAAVFYVHRVDSFTDVITAVDATTGAKGCGASGSTIACGNSDTLTLAP